MRNGYITKCLWIAIFGIWIVGCKQQNHIDKYGVRVDSLLLLPDNAYGYRHGEVYVINLGPTEYIAWFSFDKVGDHISHISQITDCRSGSGRNKSDMIQEYGWDTLQWKKDVQKFVDLSRRYKFGQLHVERKNLVSFTYKESVGEQYVKTFNDSVTNVYHTRTDKKFRLLENGWFEYMEE